MDMVAQDQNEQDEIEARIAALGETLLKKRDEAVAGRAASGVERRWREDQRAFEGIEGNGRTDMTDYATGEAFLDRKDVAQPRRSKVIVNIIRGKCNTAEGRFSEIQLPTDDKNWGIQPSPVPEMSEAMPQAAPQSQGMLMAQPGAQPAPIVDNKADAAKRSALMETEIADQLEECQFNGECRKAIRSAVRLGTGVMRGPNVVKSTRRSWVENQVGGESIWEMKVVENFKPAATNCDIWNIYPDPHCGSDPKRGAYIWERDSLLPRELAALIGVPGYLKSQIMLVLREEPKRTSVMVTDKGTGQTVAHTQIPRGAPYERWIYSGDVDREDLLAMGCKCDDGEESSISASVVFVNDRPIKAQLNTLDSGELPYDFFQWEQLDNDSPWGIGEPRKLIWQQRIITAAWRAMMDNAGDSSGAMIAVNKDIEPEDGIWEVTGRKIWVDNRDDGDVRAAFSQFQITNNQQELERIIDLALKFIDMESGTPMLAQGEKGSSPETLGGMQLLMQGADTTRRRQVKQWDDQITRPLIGRFYDWNMQYNKKREIKGDFNVDARGTSVLLVKDQMAQTMQMILQLRGDPDINIRVDWGKAIKQMFQAMHLDVLKTDEEIDAAIKQRDSQPPPAVPQVQIAEMKIKADQEKTQFMAEVAEAGRDKDRQLQVMLKKMDEHIKAMELSGASETTFADLKGMLAAMAMKLTVQKELSMASHAADLNKHYNPVTPPVMTPPTEPVGRAQTGQAFAQ